MTTQSKIRAAISGLGLYAPERVIKNSYFDEYYKKNLSSFLQIQRNIHERRWMTSEQCTSDLALSASIKALSQAKISAQDLDLIIVATDTPDYLSPSTASVLQYKLGATKAGTFDLNSACAGFVTACDVARRYIECDTHYRNILVVGAYAMSKWLDKEDYKTTTIFADGAGAAVLKPSTHGGILASTMHTEGIYHDHMGLYAGGSYRPFNQDVLDKKNHLLSFPKKIPPETNGLQWPRLANILCTQLNLKPHDVKHYFITQFNVQSIYETMDRLEVPRDRAHMIMDKYGYTGSASIVMALADADSQGRLKAGDKVILLGSGGGMSMSAILLEWAPSWS